MLGAVAMIIGTAVLLMFLSPPQEPGCNGIYARHEFYSACIYITERSVCLLPVMTFVCFSNVWQGQSEHGNVTTITICSKFLHGLACCGG